LAKACCTGQHHPCDDRAELIGLARNRLGRILRIPSCYEAMIAPVGAFDKPNRAPRARCGNQPAELCTASAPDLAVLVSLSAGKNALGVARVPHTDFEEAEAALAGEPPAMKALAERIQAQSQWTAISSGLWRSACRGLRIRNAAACLVG
jgi:hypothetical protein